MNSCSHNDVRCLNEFELIRKYECVQCRATMMCACDERIGRRFLPHQLDNGTELETQRRVPVTAGFQPGICRTCRGLPAESRPAAPIPGRTSKIRRYYWRELAFRKMELFGQWADAHGIPPLDASGPEAAAARKQAARQALAEIKALHAATPTYTFAEESEAEFIRRHAIGVTDLHATYLRGTEGARARLLDGKDVVSGEFVQRHFEKQGYSALFLESRPFHVLFGIYMWLVIQDPLDPLVRTVGFGDRTSFDAGVPGQQIWTMLPKDFGTPGYGRRRGRAITRHLTPEMNQREELQWLFDYWLPPSALLRQYLWAHRDEDVATARKLIDILPGQHIPRILRYLAEDYWSRYLGWPDLLVYRGADFFFVEVKTSGDKLSKDQKTWISGNQQFLGFPFALARIHKRSIVESV